MAAPQTQPAEELLVQEPLIPTEDVDEKELDALIAAQDTTQTGGKEKYFQGLGRRKESVARVRLYTRKSNDSVSEDKGIIVVNGKDYNAYFGTTYLVTIVEAPLRKLKSLHRFKVTALVKGGGIAGQAVAVRHGIAQALEEFDANFRKKLKKAGYLTRDPRAKERRKYGHKKARKSGRWSKR